MSHTGVSLSFFFLMPEEEPLIWFFFTLLNVIRFHVLGCDVGIWAASERRCLLGNMRSHQFQNPRNLQFQLDSIL